ncbi:hypothetical protein EWM64_g6510 [Hericium alpestre]|uniref:hAT-like transposase RNase-H fold domain-containing protein n=1 Tax=Hericium alpestre TaxID=135208 RepID=A0A4Y9ZTG7_9AGAM|nr:hypothetical protein EWM64_g6510 [Hericium alpestre]
MSSISTSASNIANSNGTEAVASGKHAIVASQKLIQNIKDGKTHRGANGISGARDIEVVQPKRKAAAMEEVEDDSEKSACEDGNGKGDSDASGNVGTDAASNAAESSKAAATKLNRAQARKLQRDLKKAAKGGTKAKVSRQKKSAQEESTVDELDPAGMLKDLAHIIEVSDNSDADKPKKLPASADVRYFFNNAHDRRDGEGKSRKLHDCRICKEHRKMKYEFVVDLTTSRRHLQSEHKGTYRAWVKTNSFTSMLPEDTQVRRSAQASTTVQSSLDDHAKPIERPAPYSDEIFKRAAIEWLVASDQPLNAFEHEKFKTMIEIASRAKNGVNIPSGKVTHAEIIKIWYKHLRDLKKRLNSDAVKGRISLTCDCWQASNVDAYFAVTAHWIEEDAHGTWQLQAGIIGFTRLNSAHTGLRLGQALFKVVLHVSIAHKVGHVSCDNASNNGSMMTEFARLIRKETGKPFDAKDHHIRCLAHVVNLATQVLIRTHSASKHYDPHNPEDHIPPAGNRDAISLVRAICVKECSSAKRKELFVKIQDDSNTGLQDAHCPLGLLLDMPVRWSSTYTMLVRAYKLRHFVDELVLKMFWAEKNNAAKAKLEQLRLSPEEWKHAKLFTVLLSFADNAQQEFSSDQYPSLTLALPALEGLHCTWSECYDDKKYVAFRPALAAAINTIKSYYDLTSENSAYMISMVLDPCEKMQHFTKNWSDDEQRSVSERTKDIFRECYIKMYGDADTVPQQKNTTRRSKKIHRLIELSDDESKATSVHSMTAPDLTPIATPAWEREFNKYISSDLEDIPAEMSLVTWWGVSTVRLV